MIKLTKRIENLPHSPTLWANDLVHQKRAMGEDVYHMGFGESPFPVPPRLEKALADAAYRKDYLPAEGLKELTDTVKDYYRPILGDDYVDGTDLIVAPGSKLILLGLQMAIEGDLLFVVPSWVSYAPQARLIGDNVIKVQATLDDDGYHLNPDDLRAAIKAARAEGKNPTKMILNSPSNPTGLVIQEDELKGIAEVCREENIFVVSDEIYGFVTFDENYRTISKYAPDITAVSTGLSKHLSLGGWRVGVGFIPKAIDGLYDGMRRFISETWSCVPSPIQKASVEAYKGHDDIEKHIRECTEIHALMNMYISRGLKDIGIDCPMAQGAFYNYPNFDKYRANFAKNDIKTSQDLHEHLLLEYNLATLPGTGFGAEKEVLELRLSGCDYDGTNALAAYRAGEKLDDAFVEKNAPNVVKQIEIFRRFINKMTNGATQQAA